ncbi:MAG: hypothetical protein KF784_03615 [Fimbriimonadaceae bacterium]|nr:hypothetical protein [Fimbriimonadaceae bacterium]
MHQRKRIAVFIVLGGFILGGAYFGVRYKEAKPYLDRQSTLEEKLAKAESLGVPLTMTALKERWPVKPEENAGLLLHKAIQSIDDVPKDVRKSPAEFQIVLDKREQSNPEFRKQFATLDIALNEAVQASSRPKLDFGRDWDLGFKVDLGDLGDTKQLVRYLGVRAQLRALDGDISGSLEDFKACYRITGLLGQDPTTLAVTTQLTTMAIVDVAVQKALPQFVKTAPAMVALRDIVASERATLDWSRALIGEAYLGIASIRAVNDWKDYAYLYSGDAGPTNPFMQIPKWIAKDTVKNAFLSEYLTGLNQAFVAGGNPWQLASTVTAVESLALDRSNGKHPTTAIRSILLPTFPVADHSFDRTKAVGHCLNVLLDVFVYRAQKGRFPTSLAEAGIKDLDPYEKGKLVYSARPDRVMVYSFGKDGVDDGAVGRTGEGGGSKDIVVWAHL